VEFIRANRDRPFLLYLPHTFPHTPLYASSSYEGRSGHGLYADVVEELDWSMGRILDTLDELGLTRNTLVFFSSDNGPRRSGKEPREAGGSAGPLRGYKGTTWEGGMRVPGIFRWPGVIPPGRTSNVVASLLDILPTLADFASADVPADRVIDGRSLRPILEGKQEDFGADRLFCYYFGAQLQAVRKGRWKLFLAIREYPERPPSLWYQGNDRLFHRHYRLMPHPELYDLSADIGETKNVAAQHPDLVKALTREAAQFDRRLQSDKRAMFFVTIPHQLADTQNVPVDWRYHDEELQPVAEIYQHRGSYEYAGAPRQAPRSRPPGEYYLQDAWARDLVTGVIASPDHWGGLGKASVYARELTREAILDGLRKRHSFGTTAPRAFLDFRVNGALMGEIIRRAEGEPLNVTVSVRCPSPIERIEICRNNEFVSTREPQGCKTHFAFRDSEPLSGRSYYYVRVVQRDNEMAWSSPVWVDAQ